MSYTCRVMTSHAKFAGANRSIVLISLDTDIQIFATPLSAHWVGGVMRQ